MQLWPVRHSNQTQQLNSQTLSSTAEKLIHLVGCCWARLRGTLAWRDMTDTHQCQNSSSHWAADREDEKKSCVRFCTVTTDTVWPEIFGHILLVSFRIINFLLVFVWGPTRTPTSGQHLPFLVRASLGCIQILGLPRSSVHRSTSAEGCPIAQFIQPKRALERTLCRLPESLLGVQIDLISHNSMQYGHFAVKLFMNGWNNYYSIMLLNLYRLEMIFNHIIHNT